MSDETKVHRDDWGDEEMPVQPPKRLGRLVWLAIPLIVVVFGIMNSIVARREIREPVVRTRHILIMCDKFKPGDCDEAYARIRDVKKQLDEGADFAELAREHSEDPGSAAMGGDLGYMRFDEFVEEYAAKAFDMKVGETSEIIQSSHGYHIIRLSGRRNPIGWKEAAEPAPADHTGHSH
jgi:peptidyl-prolyl cis-trans isomerase D